MDHKDSRLCRQRRPIQDSAHFLLIVKTSSKNITNKADLHKKWTDAIMKQINKRRIYHLRKWWVDLLEVFNYLIQLWVKKTWMWWTFRLKYEISHLSKQLHKTGTERFHRWLLIKPKKWKRETKREEMIIVLHLSQRIWDHFTKLNKSLVIEALVKNI